MKKSELSIIFVIVLISFGIAYMVGNSLLGKTAQKGEVVKTIGRISDVVSKPDTAIFNAEAKNPIVPIAIGQSSNQQPLSGGQ